MNLVDGKWSLSFGRETHPAARDDEAWKKGNPAARDDNAIKLTNGRISKTWEDQRV